jgi:NagD protein
MAGDRLTTDIAFGRNNGFISILVMTGETTPEMLAASDIAPDIVLNSINEITDQT